MHIHTVKQGESLWQLSQRYKIGMNQIIAVNGLANPQSLVVGQALVIPDPFSEYVVMPGDTLASIAQQYGIPVSELMVYNGLTNPSLVYPGQIVFIPVSHVVKYGESLWSIAQQYGTTVNAIASLNPSVNPGSLYPGQQIKIPSKYKPLIEVNAFSDQFGEAGAAEVRSVGRYLTYLSPFAYKIHADGSLEPINDSLLIQAAENVQAAAVMAVTNFSSTEAGSNVAHTILASDELSNLVITNIVNTMKEKGYQGVNIDFENVLPKDRENYNQFLRKAVTRLHAEGFFVSTSLAPKTSAQQVGTLYEAHDYPAHGEIADFVVLMTYEWGYRLGPPQPISPIDQVKAVLDYAVQAIPRNKILMGLELYARDWVLPHKRGQEAETFSMQEAIRRAVQYGAQIHYDNKAQSPYYRYTDERGRNHEVWFEDARSFQAKFNLAKDYNLRGVSYWVLGYPFPQNWPLLINTFRIRKRNMPQ